jgi:hypothetical protein
MISLFVNGLIFLFYAALVPTYVRSVHWLITLAAALFIAALPAIHDSLRSFKSAVERVLAILFGLGMVAIILADVLFALSLLNALSRDMTYAIGNALLLLYVLTVAAAALKGIFRRWLGYLGLLAGIIGFSTYGLTAVTLLPKFALLLLGAWSLALGFNLPKAKRRTR